MKTYTINITLQDNSQKIIKCKEGSILLRILQQHKYNIYAPCGGNGTCGKCSVRIHNEGMVTSCNYVIDGDINIYLPKQQQQQILTSQHAYCYELDSNIPGNTTKPKYGVGIDIGTTTLAFYFVELHKGVLLTSSSATNPQTRYGADVISRIQFCNSEKQKIQELQRCLINVINEHIKQFGNRFSCKETNIVKMSVTGNPTMLHLLLGIDPMPIALAPFTPAFLNEQLIAPGNLGITINPQAEIRTLPNISAYVGADIVAGIATIKPQQEYKTYLFLDIGTNGEMALITPNKIFCCATAAGPAFEGGNISCGMGAFPGAISEYEKNGTFKTIENVTPKGICGSGLIDIIAAMVRTNQLSTDGLLKTDFEIYNDAETRVYISQQDIREVQLAKSAIAAGLKILVAEAGLKITQIDALFLAGGFGNFIRIESAVAIGLVPKELKNKIIAIGNTSGTGAFLSLQSATYNLNLKNVVNKTDYIELSTHNDFVMEYALNMNFDG